MQISDFLQLLENVSGANGTYTANCPAHVDKNASLNVHLDSRGIIQLECSQRCSVDEILATLGLQMTDLFPPPTGPGELPKIESRDLISFDTITATDTDWIWYPYIPRGKITLLSADPGAGKTFLSLYLAAKLSTGEPFFGEITKKAPATVLYQSAEDGLADTIIPRISCMHPNLKNLKALDESEKALSLTDTRIERILQQTQPALAMFDPLQAYLGSNVDMHRANEVRPVMAHIGRLAEQYNCAIMLIMHMSKMGQTKALYRGLGSMDIPAAARSMLIIGKHPENPDRRILCHEKSSLASHGESIEFSINPEQGGIVFHGYSSYCADDILDVRSNVRNKPSPTLDEAAAALGELLGEEQAAKLEDIKELQRSCGYSNGTLYNAKDALRLQTVHIGFHPKITYWIGPDVDAEAFKRAHAVGEQTKINKEVLNE